MYYGYSIFNPASRNDYGTAACLSFGPMTKAEKCQNYKQLPVSLCKVSKIK